MTGRLTGKIAIITGGCSGIGLAATELFVAEGAQVVVADLQVEKGRALEQRFAGQVRFVRCNVAIEADIAAAVDAARNLGGLDVLFNNAGIGGARTGVFDTTPEGWDDTLAVLLRGPMLGIKHGAALMRERGGGSIICTASIAGIEAGWARLPYSVAKAGVIHLCKVAAAELGPLNIRINAICPGVVVTPIFDATLGKSRDVADQSTGRFMEAAAQMQPLAHAAVGEDIARAALYLASDDARFVTGTAQIVDGGASVGQRNAWDPNTITPLIRAMLSD